MQICLYTEVLGKAASNPDVQTSVRCVLELCSEISQDPVILVWPLLSASAFSTSKEHRQWAKELFRTFKGDHCQDLVIAVCPRLLDCLAYHERQYVLIIRKSCWMSNGGAWTGAASLRRGTAS